LPAKLGLFVTDRSGDGSTRTTCFLGQSTYTQSLGQLIYQSISELGLCITNWPVKLATNWPICTTSISGSTNQQLNGHII